MMGNILLWLIAGGLFLSLSACSEQREKITDLFRWGDRTPPHTLHKPDPKAAEDLDMGKITVESLRQEGVGMVEISPESIFVSAERQQITGVRYGQVGVQNLEKVIRTVGRLEFDEKKITAISLKIGGWVEDLYVDYTGKMVRKGQPLLSVYSPDLVSAQEEFLLALKIKKLYASPITSEGASQGENLLQSARKRLLLWDISPKEIEHLEKTGEIRKNLVLSSPADGFVLEKTVFKGMGIMPGVPLYKIGDLSAIWVLADIYEYELPFAQVGQKATITLAYFPGESFEGTATYIYPALDPKTRTAKLRFDLPNPEFKLKPEMWANVEMKIPLGRKLAVPEEAVIDTGTMQMVFVDRGQGYFEPRHIEVGSKVMGYYEVLSGLSEGERVVTSANFLVDSESRLKTAGGMGGHQH
jgi:multidrug efflux pump subunit AcrA (membrane-fusion protein)